MDISKNEQHPSEGCRTCVAIPGRVVEISSQDSNSAIVDVFGVRRRIDVTLIQDGKPAPGDWVLIHVGFAMAKISEQDALDRLRTMELLGETEAVAQEMCGYDLADEDNAPPIE